jgi:uncharacterized lipoprotein YmbA
VNTPGRHSRSTTLALIVCSLLLAACASSPNVEYYRLTPTPASAGATPLDIALAIGPVQIPAALARNQIVTRSGDNEVNVNQFQVWSGPLEYAFLRVLGENIASELQSDRIAVYPAEAAFPVDYRITLEVLQFDGIPGDSVNLRTRWTIAPPAGDAVAVGSFDAVQPVEGGDPSYNALVAAHSALIGGLSEEITGKLRELRAPVSP